jgi:hypothetical protein
MCLDNFTLDNTDHGPSATKGEETNLKECYEEVEVQWRLEVSVSEKLG